PPTQSSLAPSSSYPLLSTFLFFLLRPPPTSTLFPYTTLFRSALVATASLELGIDIGSVDLVCQLGSPHRIATLLQRVGRSGHTITGTPKGRLFPLSRDDLFEGAALLRSVRRGELDAIVSHDAPLDVLAQQIAAEASCRDYAEDELFDLVRRA